MRRLEATKLMLPHYLNNVLFDSRFSKQDTISTQLNMVHNVSFYNQGNYLNKYLHWRSYRA